jgi:hypothetical protein
MTRQGATATVTITMKKKARLEAFRAAQSLYYGKLTLAEFDRLLGIPPVRRPIWLGRAGIMGEA